MPQATDELREKMNGYYGDPIDMEGPVARLKNSGFKLERGFYWTAPKRVKSTADLSDQERDSLCFLIDEWDFDGAEFSSPNLSSAEER